MVTGAGELDEAQVAFDDDRFGGGGAANAAWCQIKADICDRTIAVAETSEPGILGAAIVALTALGRFRSLETGQEALVRVRRRFEPRPDEAAFYSRLYGLFREAESNVAVKITEAADKDSFEVAGRGELQLGVLIETMRREGFEIAVGRPRVLFQTDPKTGQKLEIGRAHV